MTQFLLLTLYAPLASWGDIAVGEARGSWDYPSRSAVFGLVAGALGLDRTDQTAHDALDDGYGLAVRLDAAGTPMIDYHTAQTVAESVLKKKRPTTRKEMLECGDRETILSRRSYRADSLATAALWAYDNARWPLSTLTDAIRKPVFVPYAGRKSNPLGLPLDPEVIEAATLAEAFCDRTIDKLAEHIGVIKPRGGWGREIAYDIASQSRLNGPLIGLNDLLRRETRRDANPHRTRWQFAERTVEIARLPDQGRDVS